MEQASPSADVLGANLSLQAPSSEGAFCPWPPRLLPAGFKDTVHETRSGSWRRPLAGTGVP